MLERICEELERLNLPYSELYLLRTSNAIDDFFKVTGDGDSGGVDGTDDVRLCQLHSNVMRKLVDIYLSQGEYPQAEQLLKRLQKISAKSAATLEQQNTAEQVAAEQVAGSLYWSSKKMAEVLQRLNVPPKYLAWLNCKGDDPFPSIERATIAQNPRVAKILHETGQCDLSEADILLRQALHIAAETSDLALLNLVMQQSPQLLASRDLCSMTALCIAAYCGHTDFFKALVDAGADLKHRDEDGRSILSIASGAGHLDIVVFILEKGLSPNDDTGGVCSPLHAAAAGGHRRVCEYLLENGAWAGWISNWKTPAQAASDKGHTGIATMISKAELCAQNQTPTSRLFRSQDNKFNLTESLPTTSKRPVATAAETQPSTLSAEAASAALNSQNVRLPSALEPSWIPPEGKS